MISFVRLFQLLNKLPSLIRLSASCFFLSLVLISRSFSKNKCFFSLFFSFSASEGILRGDILLRGKYFISKESFFFFLFSFFLFSFFSFFSLLSLGGCSVWEKSFFLLRVLCPRRRGRFKKFLYTKNKKNRLRSSSKNQSLGTSFF